MLEFLINNIAIRLLSHLTQDYSEQKIGCYGNETFALPVTTISKRLQRVLKVRLALFKNK